MTGHLLTWAVLPLNSKVGLEAVAAALADFNPRLEGQTLRISDFFHVRVAATQVPSRLDWSYASSTAPIGTTSVEILAPHEGWLGRNTSPELMSAMGFKGLSASITADRYLQLTAMVCKLAALVTAVIQPLAGYMAFPIGAFVADAKDYIAKLNPGPLWTYHLGRASGWIESSGLVGFGLPEIAMPMDPSRQELFESTAYAVMQAMISNGPLPLGTVFGSQAGEFRVEAELSGAVWLQPTKPVPGLEAAAHARACVGRKRALAALIGPHSHYHLARGAQHGAQEHFFLNGECYAMTNGVSDVAQPGGSPEDQNTHVELVVHAGRLGAWAGNVLAWAGQSFHAHDGARPFRAFDRFVLPAPMQGIAAVMFWPFGHLQPEPTRRVELWVLLPLTTEELRQFRANPESQGQWIEDRETRRDIHLVEQRWDALATNEGRK
ncbi:hypothetical protein JYK02_36020 [Corallococcus macrosporus]|uniref:Uncharacterized protein n=1 Tax=Corallococcus macrosporus TaxID=35 RepID=A0ABS3DNM4_9BACT|nr:hypothetical protein [Corallococcus macrosporus]MBN8232934.1 hypothetical protein [Corallococcus macrosporus]